MPILTQIQNNRVIAINHLNPYKRIFTFHLVILPKTYCPIVPLVSACAMVGLAELSKVSTLAPLLPL